VGEDHGVARPRELADLRLELGDLAGSSAAD
jgi:hypothetical protein